MERYIGNEGKCCGTCAWYRYIDDDWDCDDLESDDYAEPDCDNLESNNYNGCMRPEGGQDCELWEGRYEADKNGG